MSATAKDYFELHFTVLIWGFTAVLGLLITLPAVEVVLYRTLIAFIGLGLLILVRRGSFGIGNREITKIAGTGLLIGLHWICFFESARMSTASVSLAGMATTSLWTSLLEPIMVKGKKLQWFEPVLGLIAIAGIVIIFNVEVRYIWGLVVGIVAALLSAVFTIINSRLTIKHDHFVITYYEMLSAFVAIFFFLLLSGSMADMSLPQSMDWLWLLILGLVCTVYAYSISVKIMRRLTPFTVNLTVNLEPIYGILLAVVIFGEKEEMNPGFYWGTGLILLSVLLYPIIKRYERRRTAVRTSA